MFCFYIIIFRNIIKIKVIFTQNTLVSFRKFKELSKQLVSLLSFHKYVVWVDPPPPPLPVSLPFPLTSLPLSPSLSPWRVFSLHFMLHVFHCRAHPFHPLSRHSHKRCFGALSCDITPRISILVCAPQLPTHTPESHLERLTLPQADSHTCNCLCLFPGQEGTIELSYQGEGQVQGQDSPCIFL